MQTLAVANMAEFNESTRRIEFSPSERASWMRASDALADMAAFWGHDAKVLLAPPGVDREWLADVCEQMECRIDVVEPAGGSGRLLEDVLADAAALSRLAELLGEHASVEPWGATGAVLDLVAALRALGVRVEINAPTRADLWSVCYLDSKIALSDLVAWIPGLRVPRSHTALTFDHLVGLLNARDTCDSRLVVKSNVGVGGFGTFITPPSDGNGGVLEALGKAMDAEPVFREGPFLVQEYVPSAASVLRPTYDGIVVDRNDVEDVGVGGMLIDGAEYRGVVVGDLPLPREALDEARRIGRAIGRAAGQIGYRGWYDVDFVLSDDGELFATEINARRTSPTHAFAAFERWGSDPAVACVLADDHVPVAADRRSWRQVHGALEDARRDGIRCAATIVRPLRHERPAAGLVIGAESYQDARQARDELAVRLSGATRRVRAGLEH